MVSVPEEKIKAIGSVLNDRSKSLKTRFRALFSLRNIVTPLSISCISEGFSDKSALLKHELAYCLGQMQDISALALLVKVLENTDEEPIVRHEAAEALGAIGSSTVVNILEKYSNDKVPEVAQTCQLALDRLNWLKKNLNHQKKNSNLTYSSVDPAPASDETDLTKLSKVLMDDSLGLFERYQAMFALRNIGTNESALILTRGLETDNALFSHEVAFVLGQLQNKVTVPALIKCLEDKSKNEMVRHECAEALGTIATQECIDTLIKYLNDDKQVVRESCEIALDMCSHENSKEFQYAFV